MTKNLSKKLALLGGKPVRVKPMPQYNTIGKKEEDAAMAVLKTRKLSGFHGTYDNRFLGGPFVRKFEDNFKKIFKTKYAISCNSATTALQVAIGAVGIGPGDEVITSPFTMAATPISILLNGAIPVFADIDPKTFNIDPKSVEKLVSKKTKAILAVNIFGGSSDYDALKRIAKKRKLLIIEDNAQGVGGTYKKKYLGTVGDVGVFSFNVHKILQSGEGGLITTDDKNIAFRAQLIRNHGEVAANQIYKDTGKFEPVAGSNYRMTEIQAAIANAQLGQIKSILKKRLELVRYLSKKLSVFKWISVPYIMPDTVHVHFLYPLIFHPSKAGITKETFIKAMVAENVPISAGYVEPIYLLAVFQKRKMYPRSNFPFNLSPKVSYKKGICPVTERIHEKDMVMLNIIHNAPSSKKDIDDIVRAFQKIDSNLTELRDYERQYEKNKHGKGK